MEAEKEANRGTEKEILLGDSLFLCLFYKKESKIYLFCQKDENVTRWERDLHYIRAKEIKSEKEKIWKSVSKSTIIVWIP